MIETHRVLQPLNEAAAAIADLQHYESTADLGAAVQATNAAVQRSLRYLLRADKGAPDDLRLAALSPAEMTSDRLIPALRQRNLISLDLAGQIHDLEQASARAQQDSVRASDADLALRVVDQLRAEVQAVAEKSALTEKSDKGEKNVRDVAHGAVEAGALDEVHAVPTEKESRHRLRPVIAAAAVVVVALLLWLLFFHKSKSEAGIQQFNKQDFSGAERTLSAVVNDDPGDARAAYYLAILYRRTQRYDDAGRVLRRSIEKNPNDPYLHEELGNLFMVLQHPDLAAKQYRAAQTSKPDNARYWVKLVQALRAAGDPEAEAVAQQAPEEARALLRTAQ